MSSQLWQPFRTKPIVVSGPTKLSFIIVSDGCWGNGHHPLQNTAGNHKSTETTACNRQEDTPAVSENLASLTAGAEFEQEKLPHFLPQRIHIKRAFWFRCRVLPSSNKAAKTTNDSSDDRGCSR